jgi:hypothetical protein
VLVLGPGGQPAWGPPSGGLPAGADPGEVLTVDAGGNPAWVTPVSGGAGANPTALVGLTAVNGVATTHLRSDGAPALSQAIAPTWTGLHTFSAGAAGPFATFVDASQPTYSKPNFRRINAATAPFTGSTVGVGLAFDYTGAAAAGIYISNGGLFILETLAGGGQMRLNSPTVRLENELSAAPLPRTLLIGGSSRPGTDSNIGGANGTIQSGLGTGTGAGSSLVFQTPTTVGAGSGVQTYATRLTLNASGAFVVNALESTVGFWVTGKSGWGSPTDGIITLYNNLASSFTRLQFGGTTAAFPALSRSSAVLNCVLADGSNFADFRAKVLMADTTLNLVSPTTPASATAAGTTGNIVWDTGFIYVCTATNVWKRAALATW